MGLKKEGIDLLDEVRYLSLNLDLSQFVKGSYGYHIFANFDYDYENEEFVDTYDNVTFSPEPDTMNYLVIILPQDEKMFLFNMSYHYFRKNENLYGTVLARIAQEQYCSETVEFFDKVMDGKASLADVEDYKPYWGIDFDSTDLAEVDFNFHCSFTPQSLSATKYGVLIPTELKGDYLKLKGESRKTMVEGIFITVE